MPKSYTAVRRKVEYKFLMRKTDIVSTLQSAHSDDEARPATYSIGTGESYPREIKRLVCEADHSPQYSAEVKNGWSYTHFFFCHHGGSRNNFQGKVRLVRYSIHLLRIMMVCVSNIILWARCYEVFWVSLSTST